MQINLVVVVVVVVACPVGYEAHVGRNKSSRFVVKYHRDPSHIALRSDRKEKFDQRLAEKWLFVNLLFKLLDPALA